MNLRKCFCGAVAIGLVLGLPAARGDIFTNAGVDLGVLGPDHEWAVFVLQGASLGRSGAIKTFISGDLAMAGKSGTTIARNVQVDGDAFLNSTSGLGAQDGWLNGTLHKGSASDPMLAEGADDAQNASDFAWGLTATPGYATSIHTGLDTTITASGTVTVLNLRNFVLTGGTFTLEGTANQSFIINVSRQFSLSGGASIVLAGGLVPADVLFNIRGRGKTVSLKQGSSLTGILLATKRTVRISDASVATGEIISNRLKLRKAGQIVAAAFVSP